VRVVLDPNVLVSAAITDGVSRRLLDLWRLHRAYELIVCPLLLEELQEVLERERFRPLITIEEVEVLLDLLRYEAIQAPDPTDVPAVTPDPDDDYLVALARAQDADCLVSGDRDLADLPEPEPPIRSPAELLQLLAP
jgi:uncharacterized protein